MAVQLAVCTCQDHVALLSPVKWCRVVPVCLPGGCLGSIPTLSVCQCGGSSHPTATAGQCEQREALLSVQAALLLGCLNTGLLLRSSLKIWGLPLTLSYRSWDLLSSGSHTTCLLLEREKVAVTHWGMSLLVAEQ